MRAQLMAIELSCTKLECFLVLRDPPGGMPYSYEYDEHGQKSTGEHDMILYDLVFENQDALPRLWEALDFTDRQDLSLDETMGTLEWADYTQWVISRSTGTA